MKKIKIFSAFIFVLVILYFMKFPVIIDKNNYIGNIVFQNLNKNETFNLEEKLKTKTYSNCKLIYIVNDRNDVDNEFKYGKVFSTTDQALIKDFLTTEFTYTGSDVATVQNEILLYQNNKCVFRTSVIADGESEGLQSSDLGWIKSKKDKKISKVLNQLESNYFPIVFLK